MKILITAYCPLITLFSESYTWSAELALLNRLQSKLYTPHNLYFVRGANKK